MLRQNAICDMAALIMREAGCIDVQLEPGLQDCSNNTSFHQHTNVQTGARLDVSARGIFGTFDPSCPSNLGKP